LLYIREGEVALRRVDRFLSLLLMGVGGLCRATEALCGVLSKFYAAPHTHAYETNMPQHSLCGEKQRRHMEAGTKSNADEMQRGSQAVLWQLKKFYVPKRKPNKLY
jgi:hypothetical protein